ncbi:forkhead box protein N1 [Trichomycterus rosablanca]|uniref:forkhead box protein N1 n=1 Tax=Trichomycterus rosablanca TaxID=2290929 RepID=UPI002F35C4AB
MECALSESLSPDTTVITDLAEQNSWTPLSTTLQPTVFMKVEEGTAELQNGPEEPPSYSMSTHSTYDTLSPLQQQFSGEYLFGGLESSSRYSYQNISSQTNQDTSVQPPYPKPIYSYSILIFMALRNSRTGSLPVSEIYSFMTEHFPYFKTAPDGWKNSVRHNLSLNKCFEKVENKNGNASRKGCLWSLNPAKVEKMQEELQKWRRKDPITVRRSMARPELLDHLLGERPEKLKSLSSHLNNHTYSTLPRASLLPPYTSSTPLRRPHYSYYSMPSQATPQQVQYLPSNSQTLSLYSPIPHQQPSTRLPHRTGSLDSPLLAHTPPSYSATLQSSHNAATSMQELLMEGELSNDIDTLNPSLTDLQLHGHLWEELRDDSLAPDSLTVIDTPATPDQLSPNHAGDCGRSSSGSGSGDIETAGHDNLSELYITGLCPSGFSSAESIASLYSAPISTPIPLL